MLMRSLNHDKTNYDSNCCIMCIVLLTDVALFSKSIISILGTTMMMMMMTMCPFLPRKHTLLSVFVLFSLLHCVLS